MTEDPRERPVLTTEEIEEKIRRRKQRTVWGSILAAVGLGAALAAIFWKDDYLASTLFLLVALVGAGFVDPNVISRKLGGS